MAVCFPPMSSFTQSTGNCITNLLILNKRRQTLHPPPHAGTASKPRLRLEWRLKSSFTRAGLHVTAVWPTDAAMTRTHASCYVSKDRHPTGYSHGRSTYVFIAAVHSRDSSTARALYNEPFTRHANVDGQHFHTTLPGYTHVNTRLRCHHLMP